MPEKAEVGEHGSISNVYIMVDGAAVFHVKYWGVSVEPNLVTGFLSAMASFAREVSQEGVLKTISIPPLKIAALQVMENPQVIVCIIAEEKFPILAAEEILQGIAKVFLDRHSQDIVNLRGIDLTSELREEVHGAILSSLKLILDRLCETEMGGEPAPKGCTL